MNNNDKDKFTWKVEKIDISEYGFDENTEREMIEDIRRSIDREIINRVIELGRITTIPANNNTIEEKIEFYDKKYNYNKGAIMVNFLQMAENGLLNSIYFRTKKILRDYCE